MRISQTGIIEWLLKIGLKKPGQLLCTGCLFNGEDSYTPNCPGAERVQEDKEPPLESQRARWKTGRKEGRHLR